MTDKITLELTLDELKLIDKYVELNDETQSVFDKIKVAYPQPQMTLQQEGEYAVVSFNDKVYYRLQGDVTFSWYIKKGVNVGYPVPTLMMVNDAETERLLEGLYYNHIQVKKEKEQRTKTPVEECYKDWWGQYPETGTWDGFDEKRWQGFQAGYEFAYAISKAKEVMEKVQKEQEVEPSMTNCVITGNPPDGYVTWQEWYNELGSKGILHNLRISSIDYKPTPQEPEVREWDVIRESVNWCKEHPGQNPLDWVKPQTPEQVNTFAPKELEELVEEGMKHQDDYPYKKYTPEETEQSLKEAFVKAQQTEKWKEIQKLIDEEDNDKNFKNSLDLIKEWGEKNKPKTLYQICMEWWNEVFVNQMDDDICVDVLVSKIDKEFIPPSSKRNTYEWEKCLKIMRDKLR